MCSQSAKECFSKNTIVEGEAQKVKEELGLYVKNQGKAQRLEQNMTKSTEKREPEMSHRNKHSKRN